MITYKYATSENLVVMRFDADGVCRLSCLVTDPLYMKWAEDGGVTLPAD